MYEASPLEYVKLAIFYAGWLYVPAAAFLAWVIATRSPRSRFFAAALLLALSALAYARFIEPRILLTVEHDIALTRCFPGAGEFRLAVFSDTHIGIFANTMPIARIARAAAKAKPDAVMIAGDLTYNLDPQRYAAAYAALGAIGAPVYFTLGNHDVGLPGPDVSVPLARSLADIGAVDLDNRAVRQEVRGRMIEFAGLSDLWQGRQDVSVVAGPAPVPRIALTHNPKTLLALPPNAAVDLLVAGHTHGGQIHIPFVTCALVDIACNPIRYGFRQFDRALFVTSGTGMIGLPMRFMVPPRVDVLNVSYAACPPQ